MGSINQTERTYTTGNGSILHLLPISSLIIERLHNDITGKPVIPQVEVLIAGKHARKEPNPADPEYLEALQSWELEHNRILVKYVFLHGVSDEVPRDFAMEHKEYFPNATNSEMKYLWVASFLTNNDEIQDLMNAIIGQTSVTKEGLAEAGDSFRDNGRGDGHQELPIPGEVDRDTDIIGF